MCTTRPSWFRQAGFTLVELIFFIVVVAVGITGILMVMDVSVKSGSDPMVRKQAMALADSIMEEILLKPYDDPDGTSGETTRATFDDVSDYDGKTQAVFTDLPSRLSAYSIQISVTASTLGTVAAKRVTVTVSRGGDSITLHGYRTQDPT